MVLDLKFEDVIPGAQIEGFKQEFLYFSLNHLLEESTLEELKKMLEEWYIPLYPFDECERKFHDAQKLKDKTMFILTLKYPDVPRYTQDIDYIHRTIHKGFSTFFNAKIREVYNIDK